MGFFNSVRLNKLISIVLVVLLLMTNVFTLPVFAAKQAGLSGKTILGDSVLNYKHNLVDNGDGTFTYSITLDAAYAVVDKNIKSTESKNGYFTAAKSGQYLIELWGGDGAAGEKTSYNEGGKGGQGGHIYGTVHLDVGESLYWQLGGHGSQTKTADQGGGANGTGGGHGDWGSYTVGGGGGYSAVYKFEANTFESVYVNDEGELIGELKENDRNSKYIMIAGGGGGGGAGNGYALGATITGTPDGGAGGSINSTAGELSGEGYDVEGTFFKGSDGRSSGTSTTYVGKGATNLPGKVSNTILEWAEGTQPNDWKGTYNSSTAGGSGGSGEIRGGGGGAGFCGGSGGCMTSILLPSNVGGGGGGSSFIANEVNYTSLDSNATSYVKNTNPAETGGAVCVTYLGEVDKTDFQNITVSAIASEYFWVDYAYIDVNGNKVTVAEWESQHGDHEHDHDGANVRVAELGLTNASDGTASITNSSITLEITLSPIKGFAGGNNVPLLGDPANRTAPAVIRVQNDKGAEAVIPITEACSRANVPYNFNIVPKSYVNNTPGKSYQLTDLYEDRYASSRADINAGTDTSKCYDFIDEISTFYVTDEQFNKITASAVAPLETTNYHISMDVTPINNGVAKVGTPVAIETLFEHSTITILLDNQGLLGDNTVTYNKNLEYDTENKCYVLSLTAETDSTIRKTITPQAININYLVNGNPGTDILEYDGIVEASGYYRIEIWGGKGGNGGGATIFSADGGKGGGGGYVSGFVHLNKGEEIYVDIGRNGNQMNTSWLAGTGGEAGEPTVVRIGTSGALKTASDIIMVAGSGAGGGGSVLWRAGKDAAPVSATNTGAVDTTLASYTGTDGQDGSAGSAAGTSGANYYDASRVFTSDSNGVTDWANGAIGKDGYNVATSGGAVSITCIKLDPVANDGTRAKLGNYIISAQFSKYFDIKTASISAVNLVMENGNEVEVLEPALNLTSVSVLGDNYLTIQEINPSITAISAEQSTVNFKVKIPFVPKAEFLGGNDVPVLLDNANNDCKTGMKFSQVISGSAITSFDVQAKNETDWANVALNVSGYLGEFNAPDFHTRTQGSPGIHRHDMIRWTQSNPLPTTWEADYVKTLETIKLKSSGAEVTMDPVVPNPDVTTEYIVEAGIVPLRDAVRATVIDSVEGETFKKDVTIFVTTYVTYDIHNLSTSAITDISGNVNVVPGFPHEATLTPHNQYMLPDSISVTFDASGEAVPHTYNKTNGYLHIAAEYLTEPITIQATAKQEEHKLHYAWEDYDSEQDKVIEHVDLNNQYYSVTCGTDMAPYVTSINAISVNEYPGHYFVWEWGTEGNTPPAIMPHGDILVRGVYKPTDCALTINYYTETKLHSTTTVALKYNDAYNIESPVIPGYVTEWPVVSGVITGTAVTIDVNYIKSNGRITVNYIASDDGSLLKVFTEVMEVGDKYDVVSPDIPGYVLANPEEAVISGTMPGIGATYRVYYNPAHFIVTFDTTDGTPLGTPTREAVYKQEYMYEGASGEFIPLPTPIYVGHEFSGWYLDPECTQKVTDETTVSAVSDHTLYAGWGARSYTVTVDYVDEHGNKIATSASITLELNKPYSITSPAIEGYTLADPEQDVVEGFIKAQNTHITVHYVKNTHTLTIHYRYSDTIKNEALHGTTPEGITGPAILVLEKDDVYNVTSPAVSGYHPSIEVVSGVMGTKDIEVTVLYLDDVVEISVNVSWGDMTFDYTHGKWQPDVHRYEADTIEPSSVNSNKITVSNNSDIGVTAQFSYTPAVTYSAIDAYFTKTDQSNGSRIIGYNLQMVESQSAWLWLTGTLPESTSGTIISGTCTVTIRGGWLI